MAGKYDQDWQSHKFSRYWRRIFQLKRNPKCISCGKRKDKKQFYLIVLYSKRPRNICIKCASDLIDQWMNAPVDPLFEPIKEAE